MAPDEWIFPMGHIKGQCAAAQATKKDEELNFLRWNKKHIPYFNASPGVLIFNMSS